MKKTFLLVFMMGLFFNVFAITPETLIEKKENIQNQLQSLDQIEKIILEEGLTYQELAVKYPDLVAKANVASENEDGIFSKESSAPLGVPGFFWGFFLGLLGVAIVYFAMEEGSTRKEQVKYALFGCVGIVLVWLLFSLAFSSISFL